MPNNLHDGHRKRVREEILNGNYNELTPPHKILEALLFYSIPRGDTNEIAHALIERFGSFEQVFEADFDMLKTVNGVGENTAMFLKLVGIAVKRSLENRNQEVKCFESMDELCDMIFRKYYGINREVVSVVSLDSAGMLLGFDFVGQGDIATVGISIRSIFEIVLKRGATNVVSAHNHPGGSAVPSPEDLEATRSIVNALASIGVALCDHIIVVRDDYVSLKQSAQFKYLFE